MKKLKDCTENDVREAWGAIRAKKPLIFHITNDVAASLQANVCLAVGASPLMSRHPAETEELVAISDGFLANLGTPTADSIEAVTLGLAAAGRAGRMTLLDPVGYGANIMAGPLAQACPSKSNPSPIFPLMAERIGTRTIILERPEVVCLMAIPIS